MYKYQDQHAIHWKHPRGFYMEWAIYCNRWNENVPFAHSNILPSSKQQRSNRKAHRKLNSWNPNPYVKEQKLKAFRLTKNRKIAKMCPRLFFQSAMEISFGFFSPKLTLKILIKWRRTLVLFLSYHLVMRPYPTPEAIFRFCAMLKRWVFQKWTYLVAFVDSNSVSHGIQITCSTLSIKTILIAF